MESKRLLVIHIHRRTPLHHGLMLSYVNTLERPWVETVTTKHTDKFHGVMRDIHNGHVHV